MFTLMLSMSAIESFRKASASPVLINPNPSASDDHNNHVKAEDVMIHGASYTILQVRCQWSFNY